MRIEERLLNLIKKGKLKIQTEGRGGKNALQERLANEFYQFMKDNKLMLKKRRDEKLILAESVAFDAVNDISLCRHNGQTGKWEAVYQDGGKKKK